MKLNSDDISRNIYLELGNIVMPGPVTFRGHMPWLSPQTSCLFCQIIYGTNKCLY